MIGAVMQMQYIGLKELRYVEFDIHNVVAFSQFWRSGRTWSCLKDGRPDNGIHLLTRGRARYTDAQGNVTELVKDDVVYLPQGSRYSVEFIADSPTEAVRTLLVNFLLKDSAHRPAALYPTVSLLGHDTTGEMKTCFQDLRSAYRSTRNNLASKALFLSLLDKIAERSVMEDHELAHCGDFIRQNLITNLSVARLAEMYGISETTFRKRFKEQYGVTPTRFISDRKMELALELLRAGDITTEEIVRLLGFYDTSYFYKRMKAECGTTPADYRRTHRFRWEESDSPDIGKEKR